jgi:hypothetical protein
MAMANEGQPHGLSRFLKPAAWLLLVAVIVITLVPAAYRPETPLPLKVERALGFAVMTFVFTLAYPGRWRAILLVGIVGAIGLELMQFIIPSRDPSPVDAVVKAIGAGMGVAGAMVVRRVAGLAQARSG